jgi:hypothetical protein
LTGSLIVRVLGAAALTVSLSVGAVVSNAPAATAVGSSFTCSRLRSSGTGATEMIKLVGCGGNTGGHSKWISVAALSGGADFRWANRTYTQGASPEVSSGFGPCLNGPTDYLRLPIVADTTGSVSIGTYASFTTCPTTSGRIKLAPNTPVVFGATA